MRDVYQVREEFLRDASTYADHEPLSKAHKGAIIGHLNKAMANDMRRKLAMRWLTRREDEEPPIEPMSTSLLKEGEWHALALWIDAYNEPDSDEWLIAQRFMPEAKAVADVAEVEYYASHVVELDPMFDDYPESVKEAMRLGMVLKDETMLTRFERFSKKKG